MIASKVRLTKSETGIQTKRGIAVYAKLHMALQTLSNGLKVQRIREGVDPNKIAVIGRKMPEVVDPTAAHLRKNGIKVETEVPLKVGHEIQL